MLRSEKSGDGGNADGKQPPLANGSLEETATHGNQGNKYSQRSQRVGPRWTMWIEGRSNKREKSTGATSKGLPMSGLGMPCRPPAVLVLLLQPAAAGSRAPAGGTSSGCRLARMWGTGGGLAGTFGGWGTVLLQLRLLLVAACTRA